MPRKPGRRRGHGWSRIRSSGVSTFKRKRDSDIGEMSDTDESTSSRMLIGSENENRWNKVRTNLGFNTDTDFVSYLLDLAENKGLDTDLPGSTSQENKQNIFELSTTEHLEQEANKVTESKSCTEPAPKPLPESQMPLIMVCEDQNEL